MIAERTAAYVLAVACVFQTLRPSWTIKPHGWRSVDVQIGRLRVHARNDDASLRLEELAPIPLLYSWQKEPKRLKICINDGSCITARLDEISHGWLITRDKI
jgi:hypothetical protein